MPVIQIPDVGSVNFPDSMSEDEISKAAGSLYRQAGDRKRIEADQQKYGPNKESALARFREGIGSGMVNVGRRAMNLLPDAITPEWASDEAIQEQSRIDKPLTDTTAGSLGKLTGEIASTLPLGGIGGAGARAGLAGRALLGTAEGALAGQLTTGDAAIGAATGGVLGAAAPLARKALGRFFGEGAEDAAANQAAKQAVPDPAQAVPPAPTGPAPAGAAPQAAAGAQAAPVAQALPGANPTDGMITAGQQQALDWAEKAGMKTTPSMRTGSKVARQTEASLESMPMTSGPFNKLKDHNQARANEIVAEAIGLPKGTKDLNSDNLGKAREALGAVFEEAKDDVPRWAGIDPVEQLARADDIIKNASTEIDDLRSIIPKQVDRFLTAAARGRLTGENLFSIRSALGTKLKDANLPGLEREAIEKFRDNVSELMADGVPQELRDRLADANGKYRILKILESPGVINPAEGTVSIKSLGNALNTKDKSGYFYGGKTSDLYELARFGKAFPSIADSGTATRLSLKDIRGPVDIVNAIAGHVGGGAVSNAYLKGAEGAIQAGAKGKRALGRTLATAGKVPVGTPAVLASQYNEDDDRGY